MARHPTPEDIENARELFEASNDPLYLVLAIGAEPFQPPTWAMEAAIRLARDTAGAASHGNDRIRLGRLLDEMHREFFRLRDLVPLGDEYQPPAVRRVVTTVLKKQVPPVAEKEMESNIKVLETAWRREAAGHEPDRSGNPQNSRWKRLLQEWGDQDQREHSRPPWGEIKENLWRDRWSGKI